MLKHRVGAKQIKASTLRNNLKPIKLFCEQLDIEIPWRKLTRGMPKERKYASDRAPKLDEIIKITQYPDLLDSHWLVRLGCSLKVKLKEKVNNKLFFNY